MMMMMIPFIGIPTLHHATQVFQHFDALIEFLFKYFAYVAKRHNGTVSYTQTGRREIRYF